MADPNLANFNGRVKRIHAAHRRGRGFEAAGTVSAPRRARPRRSRLALLQPLLILLVAVFALKTAIYSHLGPRAYADRVTEMRASTGMERYGALLMQADPITLYLSATLKRLQR